MVNLKQFGHFLNFFVEKMCPSVTNQNLRAAKSRDDVFIQENGGVFGVSRFDCIGLRPLGQVFHRNDDVLIAFGRHWCNWTNVVNALFF